MKIKILFVSILFLSVCFSGCEEVEDVLGPAEETKNYIVVTVNADICVYNNSDNSPLVNEPVRIQIVKAGGERFDEVVYTNTEGCTSAATAFNVYKEQPVDAYAYPVNHPEVSDFYTLPWEVTKSSSVGGQYSWKVMFALFV